MAVIPINIARVSNNLRAFNLLQTVRANQVGLFRIQNQLASGLRFSAPSEDPTSASAAGALDKRMDELTQVRANVGNANAALSEGENAMRDAIELMIQAVSTASEAANDTASAEDRHSLANLIDSITSQVVAVANRRHLNTYLFSGRYGDGPPFELTANGVLYHGDEGQMRTIVDSDLSQDEFTISGMAFFNAVSEQVRGNVDLDPAVTARTRIADLRGTTGDGVRLGRVQVSDGTTQTEIDLSGVATLGDLVDKLNAEMPDTLTASINGQSLVVSPTLAGGPMVAIQDVGGGQAARDLGIATTGSMFAGAGTNLDPVLTMQTNLAALMTGSGVDLSSGLTIRNGSQVATLDFGGVTTIEDVLNKINSANVGVWARIRDDGRSIEILNRLSGTNLTIEENGGQTATVLGIRSTRADTPLSSLNDGLGLDTVPGPDFRLLLADGSNVDVDADGLTTMQELINRINATGGGAVTAALGPDRNGLVITDNTTGGGALRIERLNQSPAIDSLGLDVAPTGNQLIGRDVNPIRVNSTFTALLELRDALRSDDQRGITSAGKRLQNVLTGMQEAQGKLASQARAMVDRSERLDTEETATRVMLSDVRDVDISEAVVRFQQVQTALQANMATASRIMNLSLLDYLR